MLSKLQSKLWLIKQLEQEENLQETKSLMKIIKPKPVQVEDLRNVEQIITPPEQK